MHSNENGSEACGTINNNAPAAGKTAALHNLGCKVNAYETEAIRQCLEAAGYEIVPFDTKADVYVINTCTVTAVADKKSRQMLHRARALNPQAVIVAAGCYCESAKDELSESGDADIIIGNNRKHELPEILNNWLKKRESEAPAADKGRTDGYYTDLFRQREYESLSICLPGEHTRAFIKIQDGCDRFCTYCIIPYVRGRIRSRDEEDVLREINSIADSGIKEVVLTGIHISSYGRDKGREDALADLIDRISEIEGVKRIRLGSLEQSIITEDLAARLSRNEKLCPHFHLSLQSGCAATLQRMGRRYTPDEFYEKCLILRDHYKDPAITTDIIAGFPGETQEEFEESYAFVEKVSFAETHVFPYSRRKGTKAADMPGQLTNRIKKERVERLTGLNKIKMLEFAARRKGCPAEVLFETKREENGSVIWTGYTKRYESYEMESPEDLKNRIVSVIL